MREDRATESVIFLLVEIFSNPVPPRPIGPIKSESHISDWTSLLNEAVLSARPTCRPDQINPTALMIKTPFRMRRRGVELKLHLGDAPPDLDRTLVQNIVNAQRWLKMIIAGKTFTQIAAGEAVSKRRVQDVVGLALLAPDVHDAIVADTQPDGLNTDYLIKTGFPATWSGQRQQFAAL